MPFGNNYPPGIPPRSPRPRGENGPGAAIALALLGWAVTSNPLGLLAGGAIGNSLGNQPLPLDAALRTYFTSQGLPFIGFYRLGPRAAQVVFRHRDQYWTLMSRAPESVHWTLEALDDWIYGDIVDQQLPRKIAEINLLTA